MLLAVAEIRRAKARFGLLAVAVAFLIFLILFLQALFAGLITDFVGAVENQDAPILVFNEDARRNVEGSFLPIGTDAEVAAVDGVGEAALIGQSTYTVDAGGEDRDAVLFGYELGGLGEPLTLSEGRLPTGPNQAVASSADAPDGFDIGDTVTIIGQDGPRIEVVGLGDDLRWSVSPTLFVSYDTFEEAQLAVNPQAQLVLPSLVAASPQDGVSADVLADRIEDSLGGVEVLTNAEAVSSNPGVEGVSNSSRIILALAFLAVGVIIGFFFLILTAQKAKPLTLLRAVGARTSYLVWNLGVQIAAVLLVGAAIGVLMLVLMTAANTTGDVSISLDAKDAVLTVAGVGVLAALGGAVAVIRLLRIDPIRATIDASRGF